MLDQLVTGSLYFSRRVANEMLGGVTLADDSPKYKRQIGAISAMLLTCRNVAQSTATAFGNFEQAIAITEAKVDAAIARLAGEAL